jgi:hypothetical protein
LFVGLTAFALCTFYWQLETGAHLWIPELSKQGIVSLLWVPVVSRLHGFMITHRILGNVAFVGSSFLVLVLLYSWLARRSDRQSSLVKMMLGPMLLGTLFLLLVGKYFRWNGFYSQAKWALVYIPPVYLAALSAGFALFLYIKIRKEKSVISSILVLLLIPPALFYLILPLVVLKQPLFDRRFVPEIFPLFFLISLAGLDSLIKRFNQGALILRLLFMLFVLSITISFYNASAYLREKPIFSGVIRQVTAIARRLPDNALVLIPSAEAGIQMELSLNYIMNRETLSLPDEENIGLLENFLKRQIGKGRPIFLLSLNKLDPSPELQGAFIFKPEFDQRISFLSVRPVDAERFPDRSVRMQLNYRADRLLPRENQVSRNEINFNDPDVSFVNFNSSQKRFRWTNDHSEIRNFIYETKGSEIRLILVLNRWSEELDLSDLKIMVNGDIPARFLIRKSTELHFLIQQAGLSKITSVIIDTKAFIPEELGISKDPRVLGIPLAKVKFLSDSDGLATEMP